MKKKYLLYLLFFIFLIGVLYSGYKLYSEIRPYQTGSKVYERLAIQFIQSDTNQSGQKFQLLKEKNQDFIGWLTLDDSNIDYPVVHGTDNDYYLTHTFDHTENKYGCLFIDAKESGIPDQNDNTIIYGHHMKDGAMFSDLMNYRSQEYYEAHPIMFLYTENKTYKIHIFAGFTTNASDDVYTFHFLDKKSHKDWLQSCKEKSDFQSDISIEEINRTITFSTCAYEYKNARYVLLGSIVE